MTDSPRKPAPDGIDYAGLSRDALRGVVRSVLERTAREGLPGEHHFLISFSTAAPGVEIPGWLRARHPGEMTVVLQHRFRGLEVGEDGFRVVLSFNGVESGIAVPFAAVTAFSDPAAEFAMRFAPPPGGREGEPAAPAPVPAEGPAPAPGMAPGNGVVSLAEFRSKRSGGMPAPPEGAA